MTPQIRQDKQDKYRDKYQNKYLSKDQAKCRANGNKDWTGQGAPAGPDRTADRHGRINNRDKDKDGRIKVGKDKIRDKVRKDKIRDKLGKDKEIGKITVAMITAIMAVGKDS